MPKLKKNHNSGCFSGLFRRLLCAGNPPQTHPSDRFPDPVQFDDELKFSATKIQSNGPGVVARLMGLESLPRTSVHKIPGPVTRSRSVNFMDYLLEFNPTETKHRRVRTSVSFREQNREFPAVFFEEEDNSRRRKSEKRRVLGTKQSQKPKEMNVENRVLRKEENQNQRKKNKKISKLKNEPRRVAGKSPNNVRIKRRMNSKAKTPFKFEDQKQRKKKRDQIGVCKVEFEQNSEVSSPISVFDSDNFHFHHENSSSEFIGPMEMELRCNKKSKKEMNEAEVYLGLAGMLCNLTEEDIKQESNWINGKVLGFNDFEDLCLEFGEEILNFMLSQVVDELVGLKS